MISSLRRFGFTVCASLLGLLAPLAAQAVWDDSGEEPVAPATDQMIVQRVSGDVGVTAEQVGVWSQAAGMGLMFWRTAANDALVLRLANTLPVADVETMAQRILNADPSLAYAEPDYIVMPALEPNDPLYDLDQDFVQWHYFEQAGGVNLPAAWDRTLGDPNLTVAVLDTGIRPHEDLNGRYTPYVAGQTTPGAAGYDFVGNLPRANDGDGRDPDPTDPGDWVTTEESATPGTTLTNCPVRNSSWHGTHVAGTLGAASDNSIGVAGINWNSRILPVRVLGKCGGYTTDVADGIIWAAGGSVYGVPANPHPAKVLSLSLTGSGACSTTFQNAINQATGLGATVVVAAGNNGLDAAGFQPASCNNVITVAATDRCGHRAWYSNYGSTIEISAPGGGYAADSSLAGVVSTFNDGPTTPGADSYALSLGTSMATPHVAGVASLMLSINPDLTPSQVVSLLQSSARPFPATNPCYLTGGS